MSTQQATSHTGNSRGQRVIHEVREVVTHPVETHPISTSLIVFGAGLGLGAIIRSMLSESSPRRTQSQAEALGRSIMDSLSAAFPESLMRHLHK